MEELISQLTAWAFGLIPPEYIASFVVVVVALRTGLRGLCWTARALDTAIDGRVDWTWPGKLESVLDWLDSKVDFAVISALLPKPGGKGAQAVAVATRAITSRFPSQAPVLGADKEHEK